MLILECAYIRASSSHENIKFQIQMFTENSGGVKYKFEAASFRVSAFIGSLLKTDLLYIHMFSVFY